MKSDPKQTFYLCKYFKYEYDDFGKYCWCHNPKSNKRECDVDYKFCMRFCPYYKKDEGSKWTVVLTDGNRALIKDAKKKLAEWKAKKIADKKAAEQAEYQTYLRLKKKYENQ